MSNLTIIETKAFVPAKDFEHSKQFYQDIGFTMASDTHGVAYFHLGNASFLLQDYYTKSSAENFMMHILVEDIDAWWHHIDTSNVVEKYGAKLSEITPRPWGMNDFCLVDPSGVCWHIGQNIE